MSTPVHAPHPVIDPPPVVRKDIYAHSTGKYPRPIALRNMIDMNKMYTTSSGTYIMMIRRLDETKAVCYISNNIVESQQDLVNDIAPIDVMYDDKGLIYINDIGSTCRIDYVDCTLFAH